MEVGGGAGHVSLGAISEGEERHWTLQSRFFFEKMGITFYPYDFPAGAFKYLCEYMLVYLSSCTAESSRLTFHGSDVANAAAFIGFKQGR